MKRVLKLIAVSAVSVLVGAISGVLAAIALYGFFSMLYTEAHALPLGIDPGPAAGFEYVMLASVLIVIISNFAASFTGIAIWSFLQRTKSAR